MRDCDVTHYGFPTAADRDPFMHRIDGDEWPHDDNEVDYILSLLFSETPAYELLFRLCNGQIIRVKAKK